VLAALWEDYRGFHLVLLVTGAMVESPQTVVKQTQMVMMVMLGHRKVVHQPTVQPVVMVQTVVQVVQVVLLWMVPTALHPAVAVVVVSFVPQVALILVMVTVAMEQTVRLL
jgi:hypothetical protein